MTNGEPDGRRLAKGADADRTAKGEDRMVTVVHKAFRCVAEQEVHENDTRNGSALTDFQRGKSVTDKEKSGNKQVSVCASLNRRSLSYFDLCVELVSARSHSRQLVSSRTEGGSNLFTRTPQLAPLPSTIFDVTVCRYKINPDSLV